MPFAIAPPWGRSLLRLQTKLDVTTQDNTIVNATAIKLYLGANVNPARGQQCMSTIDALRRVILTRWKTKDNADNWIVRGHWQNASSESIVIDTDNLSITDDDIVFIIGNNFASANSGRDRATHFVDETMKNLVEIFLENAKFN